MKTETTEATPPETGLVPEQSNENPLAILGQMDLEKIDPEQVGKLMALQERWEDRQAEKAFSAALAAFQAECPTIKKTKPVHTKSGAKAFDYAPYEVIKHVVQPFMTKHGFSSTVNQVQDESPMVATAICTIRHEAGHSETSTYSVPVGQPNQLTDPAKERVKATTIARRQAFLCGLDIACEDQDAQYYNDEPEAPSEPVTAEQANEIDGLLGELEALEKGGAHRFIGWAGVADVAELPAARFGECKDLIARKISKLDKK